MTPVDTEGHQKESGGLIPCKSASTGYTAIDEKNQKLTHSNTWFL